MQQMQQQQQQLYEQELYMRHAACPPSSMPMVDVYDRGGTMYFVRPTQTVPSTPPSSAMPSPPEEEQQHQQPPQA
jgi:hypothetical protein